MLRIDESSSLLRRIAAIQSFSQIVECSMKIIALAMIGTPIIIECTPLKIRLDKTRPNMKDTIIGTYQTTMDNVSVEEIACSFAKKTE